MLAHPDAAAQEAIAIALVTTTGRRCACQAAWIRVKRAHRVLVFLVAISTFQHWYLSQCWKIKKLLLLVLRLARSDAMDRISIRARTQPKLSPLLCPRLAIFRLQPRPCKILELARRRPASECRRPAIPGETYHAGARGPGQEARGGRPPNAGGPPSFANRTIHAIRRPEETWDFIILNKGLRTAWGLRARGTAREPG